MVASSDPSADPKDVVIEESEAKGVPFSSQSSRRFKTTRIDDLSDRGGGDKPKKTFSDVEKSLRSGNTVVFCEGELEDKYKEVKLLGEGGFGRVTEVKLKSSGQQYAAKSIPIRSIADVDDFEKELDVARKLKHPNIIQLHEFLKGMKEYHLIMDMCLGGDLLDFLEKDKKILPSDRVARWVWQMISGIAYLHHNMLVHRDIKAENYMLETKDRDSSLRLIDFGLTCTYTPGEKLTTKVGSIPYMAPEVFQRSYDEKCDIWGIGVTTYFCFVKYQPFEGRSLDAIEKLAKAGDWKFVEKDWKKHPQEVQPLVTEMLTKDPQVRASAKDLLAKNEWLRKHGRTEGGTGGESKGCCAIA